MPLTSIHRFVCLPLVLSVALLAMTSLLHAAGEREPASTPTISAAEADAARTERDINDAEAADDRGDNAPPSNPSLPKPPANKQPEATPKTTADEKLNDVKPQDDAKSETETKPAAGKPAEVAKSTRPQQSQQKKDGPAAAPQATVPKVTTTPAPATGSAPMPTKSSTTPAQAPSKPTAATPAAPVPSDDPRVAERLPPHLERLKVKVRRALAMYYPHKLNTRDHNSWEVMHAVIGFGVDSEVLRSGPQGQRVNSVSWLCYNGPCKGQRMLYLDQGRVSAARGVGVQGHAGQFLAILAQSRVPIDYPLTVDNRKFTIRDLVETEQLGCQVGIELTFKLIAMSHYLDSNESWKNYSGEEWNISRLVEEEIKAPIRGAACGGTHRLMGLSYAVRRREVRNEPIDGQFARAQKYLSDYHRYTFGLQNRDGSFSTEWFTGRGANDDIERRLQTTGHILEWLVYSLPREQLDDPRVVRAVDYLSGILISNVRDHEWEIGHLGHGVHALVIYDTRRFRARPPSNVQELAGKPESPAAETPAAVLTLEPAVVSSDEPARIETAKTEPPKTEAEKKASAEIPPTYPETAASRKTERR
jgi:hypothetical protein